MGLLKALGLPERPIAATPAASRPAPPRPPNLGAVVALMKAAAAETARISQAATRAKALAVLAAIDADRRRKERDGVDADDIVAQVASRLRHYVGSVRAANDNAARARRAAPTPAPAGVPKGQVGHVAPFDEQGPATWDRAVRTSENEHVIPKGKQQAVTHDRAAAASDYTDAHYRKNTTLRVERETALDKTHANRGGANADNPGTRRLKTEAADPKRGIDYRKEVFTESVENMKRAARETGSAVTEGQIHEAALAQDGELFGIQRLKDTGRRIAATAEDVQAALAKLDFAEGAGKVAGRASVGARVLRVGEKVLEAGGKVLAVAGSLAGGVQVGTGIDKIAHGRRAEGAVDVGEGAANLGLTIGTAAAVKSGHLAAEAGVAAGGVTLLAGVAAAGSVGLAAETVRAAIRGEETPIDVADEFYGTHFGDLHGWVTGVYSKKK